MDYHAGISHGMVRIAFASKPPANVREMLKRNGFRWAKHQGEWQARCSNGAADFLAWLDHAMNPGKPDGACWTCGKPGRFRPEGASTPVRCDDCHKVALYGQSLDEDTRRNYRAMSQGTELSAAQLAYCNRPQADPMGVDATYEDSCREQCGL
jgi:hypothetical protein